MQRTIFSMTLIVLTAVSAESANWPNWRGPTGNGVAAGKGYPVKWSTTENVVWKVALPGAGSSTPVVWKNRIFLTCPDAGRNAVMCFDRSGKKLWATPIGDEKAGKHKMGSGTNPSVATDGKHVFVYFKSGDFAALDFKGKVVWRKNLQKMYGNDTLWWDLGTSPVLTKECVVVACMHTGPSYVAAFDKDSGDLVWKHDRNLGAPVEAAQSYTTPIVTTEGDRQIIIVLGADHVTAHDAIDGNELWRVGGLNPTGNKYYRSIASPNLADGILIAPYDRGGSVRGIRLGGSGDVTKSHVIWKQNVGADVATPIAVNGKVYVCSDRGSVTSLDIESGEKLATFTAKRNRGKYYASPILANGAIYTTREDGTIFVVGQKDLSLISVNKMGELTAASPVFVDGQILIRTDQHLYCIGK